VQSILVRFGTKQRRRFKFVRPALAPQLKELGALIGAEGVAPDVGALLLERLGLGQIDMRTARAAVRAAAGGADREGPALTFADLGKSWTDGDIARAHPDHVKLKRSADKDAERLRVLCETIGRVPVKDFQRADAKRAMAALPAGLSSATRRQYAQIIGRLMALAVYPLELIPVSPLPRGWLPKVTRNKATAWLYPADDAQLLACAAVPLARRVLYGFLAREGCRCDEALSLAWTDLDLVRGVVRLDKNKTDDPRAWALSPGMVAALEQWRERAGPGALVFQIDNEARLAEVFRRDLQQAWIERPELFERTAARQPIRAHDLRATFVTLSLAAGRSETWVMDRTGHRSSVMIQTYRRAARTAAELGLGELAPLAGAVAWREEIGANAGRFGARNPPPRKRAG
jgi:integrase